MRFTNLFLTHFFWHDNDTPIILTRRHQSYTNPCWDKTKNTFIKEKLCSVPVFPEVGSIKMSPGLSRPLFSASSIILSPMRSLTLPPGLRKSHFTTNDNKISLNKFKLTKFTVKSFFLGNSGKSHHWRISNNFKASISDFWC